MTGATRSARVICLAATALLALAAERATGQAPPATNSEQEDVAGAPPSGRTEAELDALTAEVAAQLRCLVCRNQSVLESSAELSREMQSMIRRKLAAGENPEEVKAYFVSKYGEYILLKPRPRGLSLAVYVLPALVLLIGGALLFLRFRSWTGRAATRSPRRSRAQAASNDRSPPLPEGARHAEARAPAEIGAATGPPEAAGSGLSEEDERWVRQAIRG